MDFRSNTGLPIVHALTLSLLLLAAPSSAAEPGFHYPADIEAMSPEKCRGMAEVPGGEFLFGDVVAHASKLKLPGRKPGTASTGAFMIDKCETTRRQYAAWYNNYADPSLRLGLAKENWDKPMLNVTYRMAAAYCEFLGKRLPTEQEWEKAARGGTRTAYWWGDEWPGNDNSYEWNVERYVNRELNYNPVAGKKPNPYGLYDTLGNAREMTSGECDKGGSVRLHGGLASPGKCYRKSAHEKAGDLTWRCVRDIEPRDRPAAGR